MIPQVTFALVPAVLVLAVATALAGDGRLNQLPPQRYFPASFRTEVGVTCDRGGDRWPAFGTVAAFHRAEGPVLSEYEMDGYSLFWRTAQERSLYEASRLPATAAVRSVRFTWLRTFHAPVVVRVDELKPGQARLTAKQFSGRGGYGVGKIAKEMTRTLSPEETADFNEALDRDRVLALPPVGCEYGSDGASWVIDANDRGQYRFVSRWSPSDGPVRRLGEMMLAFTGWGFQPIY